MTNKLRASLGYKRTHPSGSHSNTGRGMAGYPDADLDDMMGNRGAKRKFIRFSQVHQGVLQYLITKYKFERKAKEDARVTQHQSAYRTLSIRPQTRTMSGSKIDSDTESEDTGTQKMKYSAPRTDRRHRPGTLKYVDDQNEDILSSFFPAYTHIDTAMTKQDLEILNNFIKKLNYEKYAYATKDKIPDWMREIREKEAGKVKQQKYADQRLQHMDQIIKQARKIGKGDRKLSKMTSKMPSVLPFTFGKKASIKGSMRSSSIHKVNVDVESDFDNKSRFPSGVHTERRLKNNFSQSAFKFQREELPMLITNTKAVKKQRKPRKKRKQPEYLSNERLIQKDRMLSTINCDFKDSLIVPRDYILKRKAKNPAPSNCGIQHPLVSLRTSEIDRNGEGMRPISPVSMDREDMTEGELPGLQIYDSRETLTLASMRSKHTGGGGDHEGSQMSKVSKRVDAVKDVASIEHIMRQCNGIFQPQLRKKHGLCKHIKKSKPRKNKRLSSLL